MRTTSRTTDQPADTAGDSAASGTYPGHDLDIQWGLAKCEEFPEDSTMVGWMEAALLQVDIDRAAVAVRMMSKPEIATLNNRYRGKSGATNVLSFPASDDLESDDRFDDKGRVFLGDIAVSSDVVIEEAATQGKTPADHLAHMLVHGILHLVGYDHVDDADATEMEGLERKILAACGIDDPYRMSPAEKDNDS